MRSKVEGKKKRMFTESSVEKNQLENQLAKKQAAVVGWQGYSGLELCHLIEAHPHLQLTAGFSRNSELSVKKITMKLSDFSSLNIDELEKKADQFDVIFFATPEDVSKKYIEKIKTEALVVDLSNALRFSDQMALGNVVYGLHPFQKQKSNVVANPGCYVTATLLALIPLVKKQLIDTSSIVIDAKSGTTGAGKSAKTNLLFSEVFANCLPYKVGIHQHEPEIKKYLSFFSDDSFEPNGDLFFTTHLLPVKRGIISSIYAKTNVSEAMIYEAYQEAFAGYPLVKIQPVDQAGAAMQIDQVVGSAMTHISYKVIGGKLFVFSCIDNLMKGAASQAIENFNHYFAFDLECGLL